MIEYGTRCDATKEDRMAAESVKERVFLAVKELCVAKGDVRARLVISIGILMALSSNEFPEALREDFELVIQESTKYKSDMPEHRNDLEVTMKRIQNSTGQKIAKNIFNIYSAIQDIRGFPLLGSRRINEGWEMDKRSEAEREIRRDVTSEREFFDIIRLQFSDDIKGTLDLNKDLPAGVRFALTNFRLMIMGADNPSILAESIVSMGLDKKALEFCYRARSEYQLFTSEAAANEIKSSSIDDDDTKSKIKNYYSSNADRDIELVFFKMSSLLGLMDETYNYSIFKGRQLNEMIKKLKSNEDELIKKIQAAHNKSYFDEEDLFIEKLKNNKERLDKPHPH